MVRLEQNGALDVMQMFLYLTVMVAKYVLRVEGKDIIKCTLKNNDNLVDANVIVYNSFIYLVSAKTIKITSTFIISVLANA